jgi:hypothetical protein
MQERGYKSVEPAEFWLPENSNHVVFAPIDSAATRISCAHVTDLCHLTVILTMVMYSSIGKF